MPSTISSSSNSSSIMAHKQRVDSVLINNGSSENGPHQRDDDSMEQGEATNGVKISSADINDEGGKRGYYLRWSRLQKVVDNHSTASGGLMGRRSIAIQNADSSTATASKKIILNSVSGYAAPGQVLACMGPSGSGKTSLMNVLSGRSVYQSGCVSINGEPVQAATMKRLMADIAYVKQADIFFGHLTVRDQLTYTALLRMRANQDKHAEVHRVLKLLRLSKVADSPIRMLSGGEKKRVNIGTELLADPAVLVLDECTSGLDSTSAVALLQLLRTLAVEHGKTVIMSIHQPSSAVFHSFDRLLLLSEGSVVYFGTPAKSLQYLRQHNLECPEGYNGSDHWMDLLVHDSMLETEDDEDDDEDGVSRTDKDGETLREQEEARAAELPLLAPRLLLEQAWDKEAVAEEMDRALLDKPSERGSVLLVGRTTKYNTTWWAQFYILTHRALKNSRSAIFTPLNLCKSLAIGLIAGLIWFGTVYTEKNVNDIRSYYFFTMTYWVFDAMFSALMSLPAEREVILKERASGSYHLSAYFMAKTTADVPVRMILPFLYMIVSFWMAGFSNQFSVFGKSIGCTLLSVVSGEAIGLFIGAAVYDMEKAITIMTVFTLFLMLLGGFFVQNVPVFIAWGKYVSPFKYAFDSSLQLVFNRPVPCDGSGALQGLCDNGADTGSASVDGVLNFIGVQGSIGFNVGILLVLCFLPRYLAYVALRMKKSGDRS